MISDALRQIAEDEELIRRIQQRLPTLFRIAEIESSRDGKIGMEVGSLREKVLIALLKYKFGDENVDTCIPITAAEIDVNVLYEPISVKTITGSLGGIKAVWTVDQASRMNFFNNYNPSCDIMLARINWIGDTKREITPTGLFLIPVAEQTRIFNELGREGSLKLPKEGTNSRGVEFSTKYMDSLVTSENIWHIPIQWQKPELDFDVYERWVDYWRKESLDNLLE